MRLLVTGGCGFIGSVFIRTVLKERPSWSVLNLDLLTYAGNLENLKDLEGDPRLSFVQADITDPKATATAMKDRDAVVNFAAESHVDRSILDASAFLRTNVEGVRVLLEAARAAGTRRFLQVSTDEVYGSLGPTGRFTEDSPIAPNSPYAASKAAGDLLVRAWTHTHGLDEGQAGIALQVLQVLQVAGVGEEVEVEDAPGRPFAQDGPDEDRADESAAAGDEEAHQSFFASLPLPLVAFPPFGAADGKSPARRQQKTVTRVSRTR